MEEKYYLELLFQNCTKSEKVNESLWDGRTIAFCCVFDCCEAQNLRIKSQTIKCPPPDRKRSTNDCFPVLLANLHGRACSYSGKCIVQLSGLFLFINSPGIARIDRVYLVPFVFNDRTNSSMCNRFNITKCHLIKYSHIQKSRSLSSTSTTIKFTISVSLLLTNIYLYALKMQPPILERTTNKNESSRSGLWFLIFPKRPKYCKSQHSFLCKKR